MNESKKNPKKTKSKGNLLSIVVVVLIGINIFFIYKVDQINKIVTQQNEIIEALETKQAEDDLYLRKWIAEVHNRALSNLKSSAFSDFKNSINQDIKDLDTRMFLIKLNTDKIDGIIGVGWLEGIDRSLSSIDRCIDRISDYLEDLDNYNSRNPNWYGSRYGC